MTTFEPGHKLGRFVLDKQLGKGAAGVVYLATDTRLHQQVALKVLHDFLAEDGEVLERFKREIVLTRRISHPGVCRLHDMHEEDGLTFITMEYVEGQTLASLIHKEMRLSPMRTLEILRGIAAPLDAAHEAGVVHRDLKPGNILVRKDGSICILDFGMATAEDVTKITRAGRTVGSLRFIAPEVWEGQPATPASDRYAIAVVLYACLAGRLPYEATTPAEAFAAQKKEVPSLTEHNNMVTPAVDKVVQKAMSRKPADRYETLGALLQAYEAAVTSHRPRTNSGTNLVRPREPIEAQLNRATPLTGDVFAPTAQGGVPRPALVAAGVVGVIVLAAVIAAVVTAPDKKDIEKRAVLVLDAGVTTTVTQAELDAAEQVPDAGAEDVASAADPRPPTPTTGTTTRKGTPKPSAPVLKGPAGAAASAMKAKGIIAGDIPAVDAELAKARTLEKSGKDATGTYEKVKSLVAKETIDRGFITSKQKRLRFAAERAPAATQGKISALERDVEKLVVQRRYTSANETLNRAFAMLGAK